MELNQTKVYKPFSTNNTELFFYQFLLINVCNIYIVIKYIKDKVQQR